MTKKATAIKTDDTPALTKAAAKAHFRRQIYSFLQKHHGGNGSAMARACGQTASGEDVVTRDDIHRYVKGRSLATETKLRAIARQMGVEPEELLPNFVPSTPSSELSPLKFEIMPDGMGWLIVNKAVTPKVGNAVLTMLTDDEHVNGPTKKTAR